MAGVLPRPPYRAPRTIAATSVAALIGLMGLAGLALWNRRAPFDRRRETGGVPAAFDQDATSYDRLVGANPGYDAHLRLSARRLGLSGPGLRLLDVGCGTGRSTAALLAVHPDAEIVAVDASAEMLAAARAKPWPASVRFVHARAEDLPATLAALGEDRPVDGLLAAYLVRNLPDPDAGLAVLADRLAPGAPLVVHEYSVADSAVARAVWTTVCWLIIIPLGWRVTGDPALYRYLWRSVLAFDGVTRLARRLREAGLVDVRVEPVDGWQRGIVHSVVGRAAPAGSQPRRAARSA